MSRLEVPLAFGKLRATGDLVVHAELVLAIKTDRGAWELVTFLVDSGTEMTTGPAFRAKSLDLPIPKRPVSGLLLKGQVVRSGLIRARVVGLDPTEFVFPCYFLGDPDVPLAGASNLLGLTGVITHVRFTFEGTTSAVAPSGSLVVEKL